MDVHVNAVSGVNGTGAVSGVIAADDLLDLLLFDVGAETFALPLAAIDTVLDGAAVHLDRSPSGRGAGVLRIAGDFLTVFEPAEVLGAARTGHDPMVLLLSGRSGRAALLVDHAEAAAGVSRHTLRDLPALGSTDGVVIGALRPAGRWVTLLDAGALVEALADHRRAPHARRS